MPKKVLIFSFAYYPKYIGGAEVAVKEITDRIDPKDIEFDMVTFRFERSMPVYEKIGNVNVYRVGPGFSPLLSFYKLLFPFSAFLRGIILNRKNKYRAIWSIMANRAGFAALFFNIFFPKTKFLLTLQEGDALDYPEKQMGILRPIIRPLFRRIFTKADIIQAISTFLADWGKNMGARGEIVVFPNGVDIENFTREFKSEEMDDVRKKINKKSGDIFLITTSRLTAKNAVNDVISSLKYLPRNYKFLILGKGPDEEILRKLAIDEAVSERVIFFGHVEHKEMPKYLKVSDIFIRPSLTEGMGNSFIEAMAAGIPVIATPVGGITDFLFDPDKNKDREPTGLFCGVKDPKSIAEKVLKIMNDQKLRERIVKNAKIMAAEKYDWDMIAPMMKGIFLKLLK